MGGGAGGGVRGGVGEFDGNSVSWFDGSSVGSFVMGFSVGVPVGTGASFVGGSVGVSSVGTKLGAAVSTNRTTLASTMFPVPPFAYSPLSAASIIRSMAALTGHNVSLGGSC